MLSFFSKAAQKDTRGLCWLFFFLGQAAIIPGDLSERLQKMARFRNLLVHMYRKVDYGVLYDLIQGELDDLRHFSGRIAALL